MAAKLNFRSIVFKRAYLIVKETGVSLSVALKEAWRRYRAYRDKTIKELAERINEFDYHYHYSDDRGVYHHWSNIQQQISNELSFHSCFASNLASRITTAANIAIFTS